MCTDFVEIVIVDVPTFLTVTQHALTTYTPSVCKSIGKSKVSAGIGGRKL